MMFWQMEYSEVFVSKRKTYSVLIFVGVAGFVISAALGVKPWDLHMLGNTVPLSYIPRPGGSVYFFRMRRFCILFYLPYNKSIVIVKIIHKPYHLIFKLKCSYLGFLTVS